MYDQEQSHSQTRNVMLTPQPSQKRTVDLEYAQDVLTQLEFQTRQRITDPDEREYWLNRISLTAKWKLLKLADYTGRLDNGVWKFFDELKQPAYQQASEYLKELPAPKTDAAKLTCEYLDKILSDDHTPEEKDKFERDWVQAMKSRFKVNVWCQRKGNLVDAMGIEECKATVESW